jgi:hypothetical protein
MGMRTLRAVATAALVALAFGACSSGTDSAHVQIPVETTTTTSTTTTTTTTAPPPTVPSPTIVTDPDGRTVLVTQWVVFGSGGDVALAYPSARVERIGFHQSNHEGAQQIETLPEAMYPVTMGTRDRYAADRTAADVVSDPELEVRAPVTGTVTAANAYTLYCKYTDELVFIEPDAHPGWVVKVLHVAGVQVAPGDRVVAGETVIAAHPHQLPFGSQVDDFRTVDVPWPHVHIEVVDPSIPDIPNPGSGC